MTTARMSLATGLAVAIALMAQLAIGPTAFAGGRYEQLTTRFANTPDQARVVSAGCVGGSGTEWLVGGGFEPDGGVVLVGVALGPGLEVAGKPARVLGRDRPAPAAPEAPVVKDKKGQAKPGEFTWRHPSATTTFVVRLDPTGREVRDVVRWPWGAGGATSAVVDSQGAIYVTGPVGEHLTALGGDQASLPEAPTPPSDPTAQPTGKPAAPRATVSVYVAKLAPKATGVAWVRQVPGSANAPRLQLSGDGRRLMLLGPEIRALDPATGGQIAVTVVPGGLSARASVNPRDGTIVRGGEHHWATGREPWRCPTLNVHHPDGRLKYQLYDWGGPYVGLDNLRLVSDSAVRAVTHDADGHLLIYAWSDGGNSCLLREPHDIRRQSPRLEGLGMSAWGAGVLSCAYLIKIEPVNYTVVGGTVWLAYLSDKDKPNSIWIDSLGLAGDGSVCLGGRAAWGLIRTANAIGGVEPAGPYVAVLSSDCRRLRFSSDMPACGKVDIADGAKWGIVSGQPAGRPMMLMVCGANASEETYGKTLSPPQRDGPQSAHGGGLSDGYFVLLDLTTTAVPPALATPKPDKPGKPAKAPPAAPPGVYHLGPTHPKYISAEAEFRLSADRPTEDVWWPSFAYGRPAVGGTFTVGSGVFPHADLVLVLDRLTQPNGEQNRRVLGDHFAAGNTPTVRLTLKSRAESAPDEAGFWAMPATLEVGTHRVELPAARLTIQPAPKTAPPGTIAVELRASVTARQLSLPSLPADAVISVRVSFLATDKPGPAPKPAK